MRTFHFQKPEEGWPTQLVASDGSHVSNGGQLSDGVTGLSAPKVRFPEISEKAFWKMEKNSEKTNKHKEVSPFSKVCV